MRWRWIWLTIISLLVLTVVIGGGFFYREWRLRVARQQQLLNQKGEDVKITIIEGWTNQEIAAYLERQRVVDGKVFADAVTEFDLADYPILAGSVSNKQTLEGFLFPDTYLVAARTTAEAVIEKMLSNFSRRVSPLLTRLDPGTQKITIPGYARRMSLREIIILASIIEKETGRDVSQGTGDQRSRLDQERQTVAGIFYNRLAIGQALESDSTVNYVTGKNDPAVSAKDLEVDSLYNTYQYPGLPPGPICNPSLSSIQAALNPIQTDYYYFLHRQPSGEVVYSKTFEEHREKKFQLLR